MKLLPPALDSINLESLSSYLRREDRERSQTGTDVVTDCVPSVHSAPLKVIYLHTKLLPFPHLPLPMKKGVDIHGSHWVMDHLSVVSLSVPFILHCLCIFKCVEVPVLCRCTCVQRWGTTFGGSHQHCSPSFKKQFLRCSLSLTWNLPSSVGYIVSEPQVSACFCLPHSRITNVGHHDGLLMGVDGLNPRSSRLHGFTSLSKGATSPGPLYAL